MRKRLIHRILTLTAAVLFALSLTAQHHLGLAVAGDMPMTFDQSPLTLPQPAYGGGMGFVYEWRKNHFLLQTGLHYSLDFPVLSLDSQHLEQDMIDTRGLPFIYRGTLISRTDRMISGQVTLPLYFGGEWNGAYVLAGVKAVLNIHAASKQQAQLETIGDYIDRYYEWVEDMPNHGYHDYIPVQTDKPMTLRLYDVRVGAELGYRVSLSGQSSASPADLRIGLFAEYGLFELTDKKSTVPMTQPDYTRYMNVEMTHLYASQEGATAKPHLFVGGIRFTFLFPVGSDTFKGYPAKKTFMSNKHRKCICVF